MRIVTLTRGGQVSIPADIRRKWPSNRIRVEETADGVLLRPMPADPLAAALGSLGGRGKPGVTVGAAMGEYRESEIAAEERKYGPRP